MKTLRPGQEVRSGTPDYLRQVRLNPRQVSPAKYRRKVFSEEHVHFLIQSVPTMMPKSIVQIIKSITAREIFKKHKEVKQMLWGGQFWTSGYYMNTVGWHGNEDVIKEYVAKQGKNYRQIYRGQLELFAGIE